MENSWFLRLKIICKKFSSHNQLVHSKFKLSLFTKPAPLHCNSQTPFNHLRMFIQAIKHLSVGLQAPVTRSHDSKAPLQGTFHKKSQKGSPVKCPWMAFNSLWYLVRILSRNNNKSLSLSFLFCVESSTKEDSNKKSQCLLNVRPAMGTKNVCKYVRLSGVL